MSFSNDYNFFYVFCQKYIIPLLKINLKFKLPLTTSNKSIWLVQIVKIELGTNVEKIIFI